MKKGRSLKILVLALLMMFAVSIVSNAAFIDDWLTQKTETSPGYMEGQKRGYFTGGSFSARWPVNKDYLASFESPRVNFGCGGIDAFMGGFSFLNFEYLVQKLQRILQAAPAAAFDLALKNLREPCSNVIKSMNAMSDALNSLQLDDCAAGKVIAANIISPFTDNPKIHQEAEKRSEMFQGMRDLPQQLTEVWKSNDYRAEKTRDELLAGCPADIQQVYNARGTTVLQNILAKRNFPEQYVPLMRGLVGDIMISDFGNNQVGFQKIPPCPESKSSNLNAFYSGDIYQRIVSGNDYSACTKTPDANANLEVWAQNKILAIYNKGISRSEGLTEEEVGFIDTLPVPVLSALKVAIATKQGTGALASLSLLTAKAYALGILKDVYGEISMSLSVAEAQMSKKAQGITPTCNMDLITPIVTELKDMQKLTLQYVQIAQKDYLNNTSEHQTLLDLARRYGEFNEISYKTLSKTFSAGFAARAMGKR